MLRFVVALISGLTLGGVIALIALGLVLAFRATHTFNFAHGQLMYLPALLVGYLFLQGRSIYAALFIGLIVTVTVGVLFYALVLRKTLGQPAMMGIIATLGLAFVVDGLIGIFIPQTQYAIAIPGVPVGVWEIFGIRVSAAKVTFAIATLAIAIIVVAVLRFTPLGIRVRAAGQNSVLSSQCGIPIRRIHIGSWATAALLAAFAGISFGSIATVDTQLLGLGLVALPAIVLGGMDSIEGSVIAGVIVGLVQSFTAMYLGGEFVDLITYGILLMVLLVMPQGLLGTKTIVRA